MTPELVSQAGKHSHQLLLHHPATREQRQRVLRFADRACCCPARPSVIAVMAQGDSPDHATELLFCLHHYRQARAQLETAGAVCFDAHGDVITSSHGHWPATA